MELKVISEALINRDVDITTECGFAIDAVRARLDLARELDSGMWHPDSPDETHLGAAGKVES